ncbi:MAG: C39 family peptidase [Anaerolineales bacterium]|nr:C39 family peptidase [Anaerolineales bacterium]
MQFRHRWPLILVGLILIPILVYQIPWVKTRLEWRLDLAQVFVRSRLNPVGELPPPQIAHASPVAEAQPSLTPLPATPLPMATPTPLPPAVMLSAPAHELQGPNNCGPATLAMYLRYYGWSGDQYTISDEVKPISADRNVNVDELDYYVRTRAGWLTTIFRVGGSVDMVKQFLAAGIPVMVEKGHIIEEVYFANDDYWNGHYALVTGYDDARGEFVYQDSFNGPDQRMGYAEFDMWWQQFNRVYTLVFLPHQEPDVQAILGADWDDNANRQNALVTARLETEADPQNAYAWFNLGMNQVYFRDYGAAAASFDQARIIGLPMRMLRYQFGPFFAYYHTNRLDDLDQIVEHSLAITPNSEDVLIWKGHLLHKQGNTNGAIQQFRLAQQANPKSIYTGPALTSVGANP